MMTNTKVTWTGQSVEIGVNASRSTFCPKWAHLSSLVILKLFFKNDLSYQSWESEIGADDLWICAFTTESPAILSCPNHNLRSSERSFGTYMTWHCYLNYTQDFLLGSVNMGASSGQYPWGIMFILDDSTGQDFCHPVKLGCGVNGCWSACLTLRQNKRSLWS